MRSGAVGVLGLVLVLSPAWSGALELVAGDVLVADGCSAAAVPRVLRIDPATGAQSIVTEGDLLSRPVGIQVEQAGSILVADAGAAVHALIRIDPATGEQTVLSADFDALWDVALEADGDALATDVGANTVFRVDASTGAPAPVSAGANLEFLQAIAVAPSGQIFVTDLDDDAGQSPKLVRIAADGSAQTPIAAGFVVPTGLAVDGAGFPIVADASYNAASGALVRVNPTTGAKTVVPTGDFLPFPFDVAVDRNGKYLVADWGGLAIEPAVLRVEPSNGAITPVSTGGLLDEPCGITVVPEPSATWASLIGVACAAWCARRGRPGATERFPIARRP